MANPLTRSLASLFRSKASTTSLKRLEREGIRTVGVLDLSQLEEIVGEAIERALLEASPNGATALSVAQGAQVEFLKLLGDEGRLGLKRDALTLQRATLEQNLGVLQTELSQSQSALALQQAERDRAAMTDLRALLDGALREAFGHAGASVSAISPEATEALAAMQEPLRAAMLSLLATALRRTRSGVDASAEETEVELLQRRVKKLSAQLQETQELLERTRLEKSAEESGVPSIYRELQGLKGSESQLAQRRALMREIFQHNLDLRQTLAAKIPDPAPPQAAKPATNPQEESPGP